MSTAFQSFSRERRMAELANAVRHCDLCPRMQGRNKIFGANNGNLYSKVLFVAEAPGRLGADRTGIPLYGDKTGDNFEALLKSIGWDRMQIFLTNAVLCNPRNGTGNNARPSKSEIVNCSFYLRMTINLVDPQVIVTLGEVALEALGVIAPHSVTLSSDVGRSTWWNGRVLVPLYHPGPRAMVHRSLLKQRSDFIRLANLVDPRTGLKGSRATESQRRPNVLTKPMDKVRQVIALICTMLGEVSYFKIGKLLYLVDLNSYEEQGHALTEAVYLRQADGPWFPSLGKVLDSMENLEIASRWVGSRRVVRLGSCPTLHLTLTDDEISLVVRTITKYGNLDDKRLKTLVYLTPPMKHVLQQESQGKEMRNRVILRGDYLISEEKE